MVANNAKKSNSNTNSMLFVLFLLVVSVGGGLWWYSQQCGNRINPKNSVLKCSDTYVRNDEDDVTSVHYQYKGIFKIKKGRLNVRMTSASGFTEEAYNLSSRASNAGWKINNSGKVMDIEMETVSNLKESYAWMVEPPLPDDTKISGVYISNQSY